MKGCRPTALLCLCLAALHAAAAAPWFCHDTECPQFKVVNKTANYETRFYPSRRWATVELEDISYDSALREGFAKLFAYISGANERHSTIPMTSPVVTMISPSSGPFCKTSFSVCFYLPHALQDSPPKPTDPKVSFLKTDASTVFVSEYGGWSSGSKAERKVAQLTEALALEGISVRPDHYFTAGYDPPFRIFNRHNEVWLEAVDESKARQHAQDCQLPLLTNPSSMKSLRLAPLDQALAA